MLYTICVYKGDKRSKTGRKLDSTFTLDFATEAEVKALVKGMNIAAPQLTTEWYPKYTKVRNLMSGLECEIETEYVGTCADPSTERYWTM